MADKNITSMYRWLTNIDAKKLVPMLIVIFMLGAAVVFLFFPEHRPLEEESVADSLQVPDSLKAIDSALSGSVYGEIKAGQGIFQVLRDLGVDVPTSLQLVNVLRFEVELRFLKAGEKVRLTFGKDSTTVYELVYQPTIVVDHILKLDTSTGTYRYSIHERPTTIRHRIVKGEIEQGNTLNQALLDRNVPQALTQVVNGILMCKVCFRTHARQGDSFCVLLKERFYENTWIEGSVLYASYTGAKAGFHEAFAYHDEDPKSTFNAHYTPTGEALIHSGLRYPVDHLHITSGYGWRIHPITGARQMHYGVDYKARTGAPVYAVAKGNVVVSSYDQNSGNKIAIRHSDRSTSYYLHLSKRLVRTGQSVRTRQIIGRAGATGRVSGPHLHFGFKNARGRWINPLTKRMIATPKLKGERLERLQDQIKAIKALKDSVESESASSTARLFSVDECGRGT
ncbi:MAG: M23 family metallopeptidase [Chitinispirillaceae bacterium]|nr:M23 family metallopeptidase [Chitinispirillaceae bacterium]